MKSFLTPVLCLLISAATAQQHAVGIFQNFADIGNPKIKGSTQYNETTQTYTLKGAGYNIWFARDEFHYAYKKLTGDFILTADFEFVGEGTEAHRKIGWMIRPTTDEDAPHYSATSHGDGLTMLQWRSHKGAPMRDPEDQIASPKKNFQTLQLERIGKKITMRVANPGEPLQIVGLTDASSLPDGVLVGLYICSHNPAILEEAKVWNVRIDKPVVSNSKK